MSDRCLFCRIAAGEIPARKLLESPTVLAFHDIAPQAPVHVLVIPRRHVGSLSDALESDRALLGELLATAAEVASRAGIAESGYRVVLNTGEQAGQSVAHLHAHVLGGRHLAWPPG